MKKMKAAVIYGYRDIRIEEIDRPAVEPGGLLVKTAACGICSGDVMDWYIADKVGKVLGHEPAGVIVEADADSPFVVGDRVFAHHHAPCMDCEFCRRGAYVHCATWKKPAIDPGGCAEFFAVTAHGARFDTLKIPEKLPLEAGCLVEPLGCAVKGFSRLPRQSDLGVVLVIGLGPMGLLNVALARHYGAQRIIAVDTVPFRLQLAEAMGADATIDFAATDVKTARRDIAGRMADLVIVGPPKVEVMKQGCTIA